MPFVLARYDGRMPRRAVLFIAEVLAIMPAMYSKSHGGAMRRLVTLLWVAMICVSIGAVGCGKDEESSASKADNGPDERTQEALDNLERIRRAASVYYSTPHVLATGQKVPCQFPASAKSSPAKSCCSGDNGGQCQPDASAWSAETWNALDFKLTGSHHYVYEIKSEGVLKEALMEIYAYGDLDCDGEMSTFKMTVLGDEQANFAECAVSAAPILTKTKENE
jgi:hypothetical protein